MKVSVTVRQENPRGPLFMQQILDAVHSAGRTVRLSFETTGQQIGLFCEFPDELKSTIESGLQSSYDGCIVTEVDEEQSRAGEWSCVESMRLRLRPDLFPIQSSIGFEDQLHREFADPMTGILARLATPKTSGRVELELKPASRRRHRQARRIVAAFSRPLLRNRRTLTEVTAHLLTGSSWFMRCCGWLVVLAAVLSGRATPESNSENKVIGHHLFDARLSLTVGGADRHQVRDQLTCLAGSFSIFSVPGRVGWQHGRSKRPFLLSAQEAAMIWHPTTYAVGAARLAVTESREMEPPAIIPSREAGQGSDVVELGETCFRGRSDRVGIRQQDRLRHMLLIGKTGQGKSTLIANMVVQDMLAGRGCCLIDPHGDLYDTVCEHVPEDRRHDVVYFDAASHDRPMGFNLLAGEHDDVGRALLASGIIASFSKVFGLDTGSAPRLLYILRNSVITLLDTPGTTIVDLERLLVDPRFRRKLIRRVRDESVRSFWEHQFLRWNDRYRDEAVAPVLNKLGQFVSNPLLRSIVGQSKNQVRLRRIMDRGQLLLVSLSKGKMGEDASNLLGSLLVTGLQLAAMSRADQPETERTPYFAYIDEFQNFATSSFASILSEARKYGLGLTVGHQYLDQVDEETLHAVIGNVGTTMCFQIGSRDAEVFAREFACGLEPSDFIRLPRYTAYARLMINGSTSRPFSMRTCHFG